MEDIVAAVRSCLASGNFYGALIIALTIPDIAGDIEYPDKKTSDRYSNWYDIWGVPEYSGAIVLLGGDDCYALRCAMLHNGSTHTGDQKRQKAFRNFIFIKELWMDKNIFNDTLQVSVPAFAESMCKSVENWLATITEDDGRWERLQYLVEIHSASGTISMGVHGITFG